MDLTIYDLLTWYL